MRQKTVFISYSWNNKDSVDVLYHDMQYFGLNIIIDKTHASHRTSIKKYMQLIGKTDYVILLLSDAFLKSENCMYEVLELLNTHELENRILPLLLDDIKIFRVDDRAQYYDYWEKQIQNAQIQLIKYSSSDFVEKRRQAQKILSGLPRFLQVVSNMFTLKFTEVKRLGYKPIY